MGATVAEGSMGISLYDTAEASVKVAEIAALLGATLGFGMEL